LSIFSGSILKREVECENCHWKKYYQSPATFCKIAQFESLSCWRIAMGPSLAGSKSSSHLWKCCISFLFVYGYHHLSMYSCDRTVKRSKLDQYRPKFCILQDTLRVVSVIWLAILSLVAILCSWFYFLQYNSLFLSHLIGYSFLISLFLCHFFSQTLVLHAVIFQEEVLVNCTIRLWTRFISYLMRRAFLLVCFFVVFFLSFEFQNQVAHCWFIIWGHDYPPPTRSVQWESTGNSLTRFVSLYFFLFNDWC
jgi:hypothetical protein